MGWQVGGGSGEGLGPLPVEGLGELGLLPLHVLLHVSDVVLGERPGHVRLLRPGLPHPGAKLLQYWLPDGAIPLIIISGPNPTIPARDLYC